MRGSGSPSQAAPANCRSRQGENRQHSVHRLRHDRNPRALKIAVADGEIGAELAGKCDSPLARIDAADVAVVIPISPAPEEKLAFWSVMLPVLLELIVVLS